MDADFGSKVIMLVIALHFVVGFGYLIYQLSPQKEDKKGKEKLKS